MKILSCFLLLLIVASAIEAARPSWQQLDHYTFEQYVRDFGRTYPSESHEYQYRKKIFESNLAAVRAHNAAATSSHRKGINDFSDMTSHEFKRQYLSAQPIAKNLPLFEQEKIVIQPTVVTSVDWRNHTPKVITMVKNQGHCGSCWAHATTECMETYVALATGQLFNFSVQQVTSCAPTMSNCPPTGHGCDGCDYQIGYQYMMNNTLAYASTYPYTSGKGDSGACLRTPRSPYKIKSYGSIVKNFQPAVVQGLAKIGPQAVGVDASGWGDYEGGIFSGCDYAKNISMNHIVQLVGYGTDYESKQDYWIVRNSWALGWGEQGYIRLLKKDGSDCGWNVDPEDPNGEPTWVCGQCGILYSSLFPKIQSLLNADPSQC